VAAGMNVCVCMRLRCGTCGCGHERVHVYETALRHLWLQAGVNVLVFLCVYV